MPSPEAIVPKIVPPPRRLLIVLLGAIGDVVRALPLLGRIRNAWPDAHIAWAVEPKSKAVLEHHRWLDEIIVYDRAHAPWTFPPFLRRVRKGHFDLVVDLQRHLKSGFTSRISGARDRFGFAAPNTKEFNYLFSNHQIAPQPNMRLKLLQYQAFGDALGLPQSPIEFGLAATDDERTCAIEMLRDAPRPLLAVILGSSWPSRIYFPESTAAPSRSDRTPARCISRPRWDVRWCRCGAPLPQSGPRRGATPSLQSAARSRAIPAIFVNARSGANACGEYPPKK
jgi:hypothetical protein